MIILQIPVACNAFLAEITEDSDLLTVRWAERSKIDCCIFEGLDRLKIDDQYAYLTFKERLFIKFFHGMQYEKDQRTSA